MIRLVDTNVLHVANDGTGETYGPACVLACTRLLRDIQSCGVLALDDRFEILREYRQNASEAGQPGVGDAFLKWALSNEYTDGRCTRVAITPHRRRGWEEYPDAADVAGFDPSDRKFVAVALAHPARPPIHNATDSDWREHDEALTGHGVTVVYECPDHVPPPGHGLR
ncbi:hypothetical protein [Rubrivirga sp.]|uniref:hypothetical protein n=1 Tax=Rubrivirga sp. TaxID=1885344 RepID=UPI003B5248F6